MVFKGDVRNPYWISAGTLSQKFNINYDYYVDNDGRIFTLGAQDILGRGVTMQMIE